MNTKTKRHGPTQPQNADVLGGGEARELPAHPHLHRHERHPHAAQAQEVPPGGPRHHAVRACVRTETDGRRVMAFVCMGIRSGQQASHGSGRSVGGSIGRSVVCINKQPRNPPPPKTKTRTQHPNNPVPAPPPLQNLTPTPPQPQPNPTTTGRWSPTPARCARTWSSPRRTRCAPTRSSSTRSTPWRSRWVYVYVYVYVEMYVWVRVGGWVVAWRCVFDLWRRVPRRPAGHPLAHD